MTWVYLAHKDGYWAGIASPELSDIGPWIGRYIRKGFAVDSIATETELKTRLSGLKRWSENPARKQPKRRLSGSSPPSTR